MNLLKIKSIAATLLLSLLLVVSCNEKTAGSMSQNLNAIDFSKKIAALPDAQIIDVRTPEEFGKGHLENAVNYDWNGDQFDQEIASLDKSKPVFVYCLSGGRSGSAADKMRSEGFKEVYEMDGGIIQWRAENLKETTDKQVKVLGMTLEAFDDLKNSNPMVLIDFYADWCEPCIKMKPFLEEIANEQKSTLKIIRLNADDHQALMKTLKIKGLPVLQLYSNGEKNWESVGFTSKEEILKHLVLKP